MCRESVVGSHSREPGVFCRLKCDRPRGPTGERYRSGLVARDRYRGSGSPFSGLAFSPRQSGWNGQGDGAGEGLTATLTGSVSRVGHGWAPATVAVGLGRLIEARFGGDPFVKPANFCCTLVAVGFDHVMDGA